MKNHLFLVLIGLLLFACGGTNESTEETPKDTTNQEASNEDTEADIVQKIDESETSANQQISIGTFVGVEQGDYFYFKMKTDSGEEKSLMVLQGDDTFDAMFENPDSYKGKKVKVTWVATKQDIPEAGGVIDIDKYIKAEIIK
jgi:outer membrane lipoprotein-sorting protein